MTDRGRADFAMEDRATNDENGSGNEEGDIFICLMGWALLRAEHSSNRYRSEVFKVFKLKLLLGQWKLCSQ